MYRVIFKAKESETQHIRRKSVSVLWQGLFGLHENEDAL